MKSNISWETLDRIQTIRREIRYEQEICMQENELFQQELDRMIYVTQNTDNILNQYDKEFQCMTKLQPKDIKFIFFATALQCIRQYLLTNFEERLDDKNAAKRVKGEQKEHSNRKHRYYWPSLQEIITNPVPFDTCYGSREKGLNIGGGIHHRAKTLGHDPVLGWIFGTMNILTSTITTNQFETYHVKTCEVINHGVRDKISEKADTGKMISYSLKRFTSGKADDIAAVGVALCKEAIHLKSDINSIAGLPLPMLSVVSVDNAEKLARYGFDIGNTLQVGKQAIYAQGINTLISMVHRMILSDSCEYSSTFEVRTRKILSYSNVIATSSNLIASGIGAAINNGKLARTFDLGGLLVTLHRLISDNIFISNLKREFIVNNYMEVIR